jgi:hypothetical protein
MASTYSPLKIELITTGEQSGSWGSTTNVNLGTAIEEAITGSADVTFASANVTLTLTNTNGTQTARNLRLRLTGTTGGARNLVVPAIEKQYIVLNECADAITVKTATGTGVAVPPSMSAILYNDGVNITSASVYSSTLVTPVLAATDAVFLNALPVTSGGTGVTTATGTGSVVRATSPTLTTPALGTPTALVGTNITGTAAGLSIGGNAATATNATNATTQTAGTNNTTIATTAFVTTAVTTATGSLGTMSTQNANAVAITGGTVAATFTGGLTGNVTGNVSGSSGSCTGNSATATLATTATTALNPIGVGQTWQTVTRAASTNYTNSTGKSIMISLYGLGTLQLTVDGLIVAQSTVNNAGNSITAIVQNGSVYSCNQAAWVAELR